MYFSEELGVESKMLLLHVRDRSGLPVLGFTKEQIEFLFELVVAKEVDKDPENVPSEAVVSYALEDMEDGMIANPVVFRQYDGNVAEMFEPMLYGEEVYYCGLTGYNWIETK